MSFEDLPAQPPIFPEAAQRYGEDALIRSRAAAARCRKVMDIAYGNDYWQRLDVYLPDGAGAVDCPVLVFAHGGAWTNGYKEWLGLMAPAMTAVGIILVSVSYRLSPTHRYPQPMEDCLAALAWVHRNIADLGGNPNRLAVGGHSAGGHLMLLGALQPALLDRYGIPPSAITACLPLSAPLTIDYAERPPGSGEERTHQMFLSDSSQAREASPVTHVHPRMPFTLIAYASDDIARVIHGNREMAKALQSQGIAHEVMVLQGHDHFSIALAVEHADFAWVRRVQELLNRPPAAHPTPSGSHRTTT